jgi:hypothetical protein
MYCANQLQGESKTLGKGRPLAQTGKRNQLRAGGPWSSLVLTKFQESQNRTEVAGRYSFTVLQRTPQALKSMAEESGRADVVIGAGKVRDSAFEKHSWLPETSTNFVVRSLTSSGFCSRGCVRRTLKWTSRVPGFFRASGRCGDSCQCVRHS